MRFSTFFVSVSHSPSFPPCFLKKSKHELHESNELEHSLHPGFSMKHERHLLLIKVKPSSQYMQLSFDDSHSLQELEQNASSPLFNIKLPSSFLMLLPLVIDIIYYN